MIDPNTRRRPPWYDRHIWQIEPVRDLLVIAVIVVLVWSAFWLQPILMPVFIGLLLAYLVDPLITYAQDRWSVPRVLSTLVCLLATVLLLVAASAWLGPMVVEQVQSLAQQAPAYLAQIFERLGLESGLAEERVTAEMRTFIEEPSSVVGLLQQVLGITSDVLLWAVLMPVSFFFAALRFPALLRRCKSYIPARRRARTLELLDRMDLAVGRFLRGRLLISLVIGLLFSGGWFLANVPYWFVLGMATGLLSIIPYVSVLGWIAALLVKYFDESMEAEGVAWLAVFLWPSIVYWIVNLFEEWVLIPWIQSRQLDLSAFTILVCVLIGGFVAGFWGLILAVPVTACLKILLVEIFLPRFRSWVQNTGG